MLMPSSLYSYFCPPFSTSAFNAARRRELHRQHQITKAHGRQPLHRATDTRAARHDYRKHGGHTFRFEHKRASERHQRHHHDRDRHHHHHHHHIDHASPAAAVLLLESDDYLPLVPDAELGIIDVYRQKYNGNKLSEPPSDNPEPDPPAPHAVYIREERDESDTSSHTRRQVIAGGQPTQSQSESNESSPANTTVAAAVEDSYLLAERHQHDHHHHHHHDEHSKKHDDDKHHHHDHDKEQRHELRKTVREAMEETIAEHEQRAQQQQQQQQQPQQGHEYSSQQLVSTDATLAVDPAEIESNLIMSQSIWMTALLLLFIILALVVVSQGKKWKLDRPR